MAYSENMKEKFRDRLKKVLAKKIETTMIYPLSQFEMAFGHFWGHEKPESELTSEEKVNRAKWKQCRNNILNNGNQQKRNLFAEIDMYEVVWNRYKTTFLPINKIEEDEKTY
jgi:hypothetical protein